MDEDNLSTLLDGLSSFDLPTESRNLPRNPVPLQDGEVNQYVLNKSKALIEAGVAAVQDMTPYVAQTQDPEGVAALAELMSATTRAIEAMNRVNLQDRKQAGSEKLKKLEIEGRKEVALLQPKNTVTHNTNVLVASREEIFRKLFDTRNAEVLEITDK